MSKYSMREAMGISFALTGAIFVFGFTVVGILMVIWWYIEFLMEDEISGPCDEGPVNLEALAPGSGDHDTLCHSAFDRGLAEGDPQSYRSLWVGRSETKASGVHEGVLQIVLDASRHLRSQNLPEVPGGHHVPSSSFKADGPLLRCRWTRKRQEWEEKQDAKRVHRVPPVRCVSGTRILFRQGPEMVITP